MNTSNPTQPFSVLFMDTGPHNTGSTLISCSGPISAEAHNWGAQANPVVPKHRAPGRVWLRVCSSMLRLVTKIINNSSFSSESRLVGRLAVSI